MNKDTLKLSPGAWELLDRLRKHGQPVTFPTQAPVMSYFYQLAQAGFVELCFGPGGETTTAALTRPLLTIDGLYPEGEQRQKR